MSQNQSETLQVIANEIVMANDDQTGQSDKDQTTSKPEVPDAEQLDVNKIDTPSEKEPSAQSSFEQVDEDVQDIEEEDDNDCELVPSDAFWHVEASLENGFEVGMVVDIPHGSERDDKKLFWFAEIDGVYGEMLSVRWQGSTSSHFLDARKKPIFPIGHLSSEPMQGQYHFEPPDMLGLDQDQIQSASQRYKSLLTDQEHNLNQLPLAFYQRGGISVDLFQVDSLLEIAHKLNPEKHWFAKIVNNVGGRLLLQWQVKNVDQAADSFWLYFCHSRVHPLGFAKQQGNIMYEPVTMYDSWASDIELFLDSVDKDNDLVKLRNCMLSSAKFKKVDLLQSDSLSALNDGDKVLVFPSNLLNLRPATIEKISDQSFRVKAAGADGELSFCFPHDDNHSILPFSWSDENEIPVDFGSEYRDYNWARYIKDMKSRTAPIKINNSERLDLFEINSKLEVVHPDKPDTICEAIIIRVTKPLVWVQISTDSIYVLPFNSTNLFPAGWCRNHGWPLTQLLSRVVKPPKPQAAEQKPDPIEKPTELMSSKSPKSWCPRIYFNHKCFTGPALSKGKISELPRFVGPGPVLLVVQEVISKIISVAYVPSRVLNELSGDNFTEMLRNVGIKNTEKIEFKAKYQKRTSRDDILIPRYADQVEQFCHIVCSHLNCCYNLFGPNLYDGDTCPGNCRGLTKSNKVLRNAAYYRKKAIDEKKSSAANSNDKDSQKSVTPPPGEKQVAEKSSKKSSASSVSDEREISTPPPVKRRGGRKKRRGRAPNPLKHLTEVPANVGVKRAAEEDAVEDQSSNDVSQVSIKENKVRRVEKQEKKVDKPSDFENPMDWSVEDVYNFFEKNKTCSKFANHFRNQLVDGPAMLLLDAQAIKENIMSRFALPFTANDIKNLTSTVLRLKNAWQKHIEANVQLKNKLKQ